MGEIGAAEGDSPEAPAAHECAQASEAGPARFREGAASERLRGEWEGGVSEKMAIIPFERIASAIHVIRAQKVMLDRDLAVLYGVETRALNQAVTRNRERFPADFLLVLTREEIRNISQSVICSSTLKHAPRVFAFTEQGVAMLSGVLHSQQAVKVNVAIMRAFVRMREFLSSQAKLGRKLRELEQKIEKDHESIGVLFEAIQQLTEERPSAIGYQYVDPADSDSSQEKKVKERRTGYRVRRGTR